MNLLDRRASRFGEGRRPPASRLVGVILSLALAGAPGSFAAEPRGKLTREYDLKAAFLFNFAQFVEWPSDAFADGGTTMTIGVLGDDPFGKTLDEMVANETVGNRRLVVRRYSDTKEIGSCQILFVSGPHCSDLEALRALPGGAHILTVGETDAFESHSGIIRFVMVENRVRLRINVEAARMAKLTISSKLLRQAEIVEH